MHGWTEQHKHKHGNAVKLPASFQSQLNKEQELICVVMLNTLFLYFSHILQAATWRCYRSHFTLIYSSPCSSWSVLLRLLFLNAWLSSASSSVWSHCFLLLVLFHSIEHSGRLGFTLHRFLLLYSLSCLLLHHFNTHFTYSSYHTLFTTRVVFVCRDDSTWQRHGLVAL